MPHYFRDYENSPKDKRIVRILVDPREPPRDNKLILHAPDDALDNSVCESRHFFDADRRISPIRIPSLTRERKSGMQVLSILPVDGKDDSMYDSLTK